MSKMPRRQVVAALAVASGVLFAPLAAQAQQFINILTGGTSGVYYPLGPPFVATTIPANTYQGQTADVPTLAVVNFLVTHEGVSDETVYQMTKQLFENLDLMVAAHKAATAIQLKTAIEGMPVPLHPGAARYYREVGVLK